MAQTPSRGGGLEAELEAARRKVAELERRLAVQEQAHQGLLEDHRFREVVLERAAEGLCVCHDVGGHPFVEFTVWNSRMVEITGYPMEEINRRGWYQSLYPDPEVQARARARMERMRQGEDLRFERWEIERADGEKRAISISTSVLTAADGSVHVLALMHDLTEEEELRREAALARRDELTSVMNRRGFEEQATLLFALARRQSQCITLGYLDIAGFKALNDARGHLEGDRALQATGEALRRAVRSTDVVGRIGGDEFAVLLPGTDPTGARVFFDGLESRLAEASRVGGWDIGFSVGVATFSDHIPELVEALRGADALMYQAKRAGRSCVVYEPPRSTDESS